jgi:hypothetical protein
MIPALREVTEGWENLLMAHKPVVKDESGVG